jgi:hypothetical protein
MPSSDVNDQKINVIKRNKNLLLTKRTEKGIVSSIWYELWYVT